MTSRAHADTLAFQTFTQRDGLAANFVTSIAFTRDGAAWIGTPRGATDAQDKYWVTYTAAHGLGNAHVTGIALAGDKIYFATNGGGLSLFDGATRKTYNTANSQIPSNYLTAVATDKQNRVWVGAYGAGIARLENEQWTRVSLNNNFVNALAPDANANVWVATNDGAFFYDGKAVARLTTTHGLPSNRLNAILIAPDGRVWFGSDAGAAVYDGRQVRVYSERDGLPSPIVRALGVDAQRRVWFGTLRGLVSLDGTQLKTYTPSDGLADDAITALAFDARGNTWVGTPRGVSVRGDVKLIRAMNLPVVLVHGWHTADSDQLDDTEFRSLRQYLERDGFQVFYAQGISPKRTLFQNAATLRDVIANAKAKTGAARVDIIAFSMGGLNTRAYLESTLYQDDVRRAIILGTPQAGVQLWYPLLTREIEDRPDEPSTIELTPEYAALFNRTHTPRVTVPYDLLTGDARNQPGLDLLKLFPPSDGLIEQWSAHALSGPLVRRVLNSDAHDWNPTPLPFNITAYLYPIQTYERYLRNSLRDPDARPIGFAAAPVDPLAPRNMTPMNVDSLRASATVTRTVMLDANRSARFIARWDRGDVELKLRAPDGTRYEPNAPRDATYLKADIGSFIGYAIPRAQPGTWQVTATRLDKASAPMVLTTYTDLDADVRLNIGVNRTWYQAGSPVVITATLSNRVTGADVRVKLQWLGDGASPRGTSTETRLLAEGAPGSYAQTINDLTRGGYYLARVTARGTGFAREQQILFAISPQTASFDGAPRARAESDALVIESEVNVVRAGEYALAATLWSAQGERVLSLTAPMRLMPGSQVASIAIPKRDLRARGIDGPYTIDLMLMDASWTAIPLDESLKALTTDAYRVSEF
ncbi:MAG: hypothetical protein HY868_06760 [Chloroflexi bacterium]|nr:hypothetical protein [Chloroflexota bacterium]